MARWQDELQLLVHTDRQTGLGQDVRALWSAVSCQESCLTHGPQVRTIICDRVPLNSPELHICGASARQAIDNTEAYRRPNSNIWANLTVAQS